MSGLTPAKVSQLCRLRVSDPLWDLGLEGRGTLLWTRAESTLPSVIRVCFPKCASFQQEEKANKPEI